jgi:hypothetical protein
VVGLLNLYVAFNYSRDLWVGFKSFGLTGLTLIFAIIQGVFLARHLEDEMLPATVEATTEAPGEATNAVAATTLTNTAATLPDA